MRSLPRDGLQIILNTERDRGLPFYPGEYISHLVDGRRIKIAPRATKKHGNLLATCR